MRGATVTRLCIVTQTHDAVTRFCVVARVCVVTRGNRDAVLRRDANHTTQ